jgi:hypothetical protein
VLYISIYVSLQSLLVEILIISIQSYKRGGCQMCFTHKADRLARKKGEGGGCIRHDFPPKNLKIMKF